MKNWAWAVLHHMLDNKRKNNTSPYAEVITKVLNYCDFDFGEEKPIYVHTKICHAVISKMGYAIQEGEFVPYQPRKAREQRKAHSSNTPNEISDE